MCGNLCVYFCHPNKSSAKEQSCYVRKRSTNIVYSKEQLCFALQASVGNLCRVTNLTIYSNTTNFSSLRSCCRGQAWVLVQGSTWKCSYKHLGSISNLMHDCHRLDLSLGLMSDPRLFCRGALTIWGKLAFPAPAVLMPLKLAGLLMPGQQCTRGVKERRKSHYKTSLGFNPTPPESLSQCPFSTWPVQLLSRTRVRSNRFLPESQLQTRHIRPPSNTQQEERWLNRRS